MFSDVSLILMAAIVRALIRKSSHRKSDPPPAPVAGRPRGMRNRLQDEMTEPFCRFDNAAAGAESAVLRDTRLTYSTGAVTATQ